MSVATQIQRIKNAVANAYTAISGKGGTLPATQNVEGLQGAIASIPASAPAVITPLSVTANGTYTAQSGTDGYSPVTVNVTDDEWPHDYSQITIDLRSPNAPLEFEMIGVSSATLTCDGLTVTGSAWNSKYIRFSAHAVYTIIVSGTRGLSQNDAVIFYDYTGSTKGAVCDKYITELCLGSGENFRYKCGFGYCINARILVSKDCVINSLSQNGIVFSGKRIKFNGEYLDSTFRYVYGTRCTISGIEFVGNMYELILSEYYDREFTALDSLTIPNTVTKLYGFPQQCPCILSLDIPSSVTQISEGTFMKMYSLKRIKFNSSTPADIIARPGSSRHFSGSFVGDNYLIIVPQGARDAYAVSELASRWAHHIVEGQDDGTWPEKMGGDTALLQSVASSIAAAATATTVTWPDSVKTAIGSAAATQLEADMAAKNYTVAWDSSY